MADGPRAFLKCGDADVGFRFAAKSQAVSAVRFDVAQEQYLANVYRKNDSALTSRMSSRTDSEL